MSSYGKKLNPILILATYAFKRFLKTFIIPLLSLSTRRIFAVAIGIAIPLSNALTNILVVSIVLWFILAGHYKNQWHRLGRYPIVFASLLLFIALVIGLFYTSAPLVEAIAILKKYRELLYIPLFILIFNDETAYRWGLNAFIGSIILTLCLSYSLVYFGINYEGDPSVFKNYITQSILTALVAYILAIKVYSEKKWRFLRIIVILFASYHIIFISPSRTGFLVLLGLTWLLLYQHYRLRSLFLGSIALILVSVLLLSMSGVLYTRMANLVTYFENPQQHRNSTTLRYNFMKNSFYLIGQRPLLGYGTGSFAHEYQKLVQQQGVYPSTNPHSEFLMITVQLGAVGLCLLLYFFYQLWRTSYLLPQYPRQMLQGLVIAIGIGCLFNSLLLDASEAHLLAYLTGLFLATSH